MTLPFSKEGRALRELEKAKKKELAELEARKAILCRASEIPEFVAWYESEVAAKQDKEINYVQFGYEAYNRYWQLVQRYLEIEKITGRTTDGTPAERWYKYLDGAGAWRGLQKPNMEDKYKSFLDEERSLNVYGNYVLEAIGGYGKKVAYLSYAYWEKAYWKDVARSLKRLNAA